MTTPTINYTHSIEARQAALLVSRSNDRQLKKMGRATLDQLCLDMGNDPSAETNRAHLIDYLRVVAQEINHQTGEDSKTAYNDPAFRRTYFFDKVRNQLKENTDRYTREIARLQDPRAFDYSPVSILTEAGANIKVCSDLLRYESTELTIDEIKDQVSREIINRASYGAFRSTNVISNVIEEKVTSALADFISRCRW